MKENRKPANSPILTAGRLAGIWSSARAKNKNASKARELLNSIRKQNLVAKFRYSRFARV